MGRGASKSPAPPQILHPRETLAKFIQPGRDIGQLRPGRRRRSVGRGLLEPAQGRFDPIGDLANLPGAVLLHPGKSWLKPFGEQLVDDGADLVGDFLPKGRCALYRGDFRQEELRQLLLQLGNVVG